jgi:hypothetical protein
MFNSNSTTNNFQPDSFMRACGLAHNPMPDDEKYEPDEPMYYQSNLVEVPLTEEVLITIPHPEVKLRSSRAKKLCF